MQDDIRQPGWRAGFTRSRLALSVVGVAVGGLIAACGGGSGSSDGMARISGMGNNGNGNGACGAGQQTTGCGATGDEGNNSATNPFAITVLSSAAAPNTTVITSGGDARLQIQVPSGVALGDVQITLNGKDVTARLDTSANPITGVLDGLCEHPAVTGQGGHGCDNTLTVSNTKRKPQTTSVVLSNYPITGPIFSGPQQEPFVCTTTQSAVGRQPLVETQTVSESAPGFPVFDGPGNQLGVGNKIGYSRTCSIETFVTYWYRTTGNAWAVLPEGDAKPANMAKTRLADGREVDFIVRQERGTINRFLYSFAMLVPGRDADPLKSPNLSLWNGRLQYWFQGGVAIGHSQGTLHGGAMNADILATGQAIVHSSGNNTGTHYNLQVAAETAMMTKERFVERYGRPLYTYGLGGSGGAIQQYILAQNQPGILDAALPVQSYPDMVTQTIHVGDCELLEYYMDVTDRTNAKWRTTKNRTLLVGLNAEDRVPDPLAAAKQALGYSTAPGSTECIQSWRGLTPLAMNPWYGQASNQQYMEPASVMAKVQWTHYDDLRNIYGVDANGNPRPTWDNVGVQYGLKSMKEGRITPEEFLDVNFKVGGWKHPNDMVQEGYPFLGSFSAATFDPWSSRNMRLAAAAGQPAPRTVGDPIAQRAAYTSGMVFAGEMLLPTIDHRQYMELELDMHNVHQSFAMRKRLMNRMGHSNNVVIWFTDTKPGVAKASQSMEAIAVMDEWMANIRANPGKSVADNRPAKAVDSCFDVTGKLIASGPDVWNGIIDDKPKGACTLYFPMYSTSRIVAGAPIEGGIYKCALKPVDAAVADGTYAPWQPDAAAIAKLKQTFPDGVCDYSKPDQARPS